MERKRKTPPIDEPFPSPPTVETSISSLSSLLSMTAARTTATTKRIRLNAGQSSQDRQLDGQSHAPSQPSRKSSETAKRRIRFCTKDPRIARFVASEPVLGCLWMDGNNHDDDDETSGRDDGTGNGNNDGKDGSDCTTAFPTPSVILPSRDASTSGAFTTQTTDSNGNNDDVRHGVNDDAVSAISVDDQSSTTSTSTDATFSQQQPSKTCTRNLWLSRHDLARFRSCAKRLCRAVSIDHILLDAYSDACGTTSIDSIATIPLLTTNCDYMDQRGLERWSSSHHALQRSFQIVQVKSAVLLEQSQQFLAGRRDANRLAKVASEASLASSRFAQLLAAGDAALAKKLQLQSGGDDEDGVMNPHSIFARTTNTEDDDDLASTQMTARSHKGSFGGKVSNGAIVNNSNNDGNDDSKPWVDYALEIFNASFPAVA